MLKDKLIKIANIAFYIALTMEIIIVILDKSAYVIEYDGRLFRITFVLFLLKLILTKYSLKEWLVVGLFSLLGVISYFITGHNEILRLIVMIAACKDINHEFMLKYLFFGTLVGSITLVILSFFGIGTLKITDEFGRGIITRYCFGMGHPNAFHCMFGALCTLFLYIYREKIKWPHLTIIAALNIVLFVYTDSRAGVIFTFFAVILTALLKVAWIREKSKLLLSLLGVGLVLAIVSAIAFMWRNVYLMKLRGFDRLITGRIVWTYLGIPDSEAFFWRPFSSMGRLGQTDLGIVKMIYWYGFVPAIIFMIMCFLLVKTAIENNDFAAYMMVASVILYSIFEGHDVSVYLGRNYIFFLWGKYWVDMFGTRNTKDFYVWELQGCIGNSIADG